jgi:hypothetical protein
MKTILLFAVLAFSACSTDPRDWRENDQRAASGDCKAIRKENGRTQWQCSDGETFWLEAYRHTDKQGDWKPPSDCKPARPKDGPAMVYGVHFKDEDAKRYRECADGQSFWVAQ